MTALTSTVPGALTVLLTHFKTVAAANPTLHVGSYLGEPVGPGEPTNNYLMIGDWQTGELVTGYKQDFRGFPAVSARKNEDYLIPCNLRTWSGEAPPAAPTAATQRLTEAFTLFDGVLRQLQTDPQGSTKLTSSGTWQVVSMQIPQSGPWANVGGWGVLMTFDVHIFNVTIPSY